MLSIHLTGSEHYFCHEAMNTTVEFFLQGADANYLEQAAHAAFSEVDHTEDLLSFYREHSDISRINAASHGERIRIAEETIACLEIAMRMARATGNAFHPFCGRAALKAKNQRPPDSTLGEANDDDADPDAPVIALDAETSTVVKLSVGPLLDLGGIGKGFALDRAAQMLVEDWEIDSGILVAGGSSVCVLRNRGGAGWTVTAEHLAPIYLAKGALGASGFGFQEHHIIDPATALPRTNSRRTCAYGSDAATADALATALMGVEEAAIPKVLLELPGCAAYIVNGETTFRAGSFFAQAEGSTHTPAKP